MLTLSKLDQLVKTGLLNYPSLYSDREDVLVQLFITYGNGYDWKRSKDGYVLSSYDDRTETVMKYDDLDRVKSELDLRLEGIPCLSLLHQARKIEDERERMRRAHTEQHIDTFAQISIGHRHGFGYKIFNRLSLTYSSLFSPSTPWGKIEPSFAKGMVEVMYQMFITFNDVYGLHYDNPMTGEKKPEPSMFSRMPEEHQKIYTRLQEIKKLLGKQTGAADREAESKKLVEEILAEEKDA